MSCNCNVMLLTTLWLQYNSNVLPDPISLQCQVAVVTETSTNTISQVLSLAARLVACSWQMYVGRWDLNHSGWVTSLLVMDVMNNADQMSLRHPSSAFTQSSHRFTIILHTITSNKQYLRPHNISNSASTVTANTLHDNTIEVKQSSPILD